MHPTLLTFCTAKRKGARGKKNKKQKRKRKYEEAKVLVQILIFWLLFCFGYCIVILFKWFVAPQIWNWYHQQRKHSFLLVGGAMKRLVKLKSLRTPFENQILTPWDMYEWTDENIEDIKFFYFNGRHCFSYLNQSEQADYCRSNWWHKKLSLFSTKWWNKAWAIYPVSWWGICC